MAGALKGEGGKEEEIRKSHQGERNLSDGRRERRKVEMDERRA